MSDLAFLTPVAFLLKCASQSASDPCLFICYMTLFTWNDLLASGLQHIR
jgi:hypothetical protein